MKRKVSKFKKHNFCNTDNSEAATRYSTHKNSALPTGKQPRQSPSAINLQALRRATLSKRDAKTGAPTRVLRNLQEHPF